MVFDDSYYDEHESLARPSDVARAARLDVWDSELTQRGRQSFIDSSSEDSGDGRRNFVMLLVVPRTVERLQLLPRHVTTELTRWLCEAEAESVIDAAALEARIAELESSMAHLALPVHRPTETWLCDSYEAVRELAVRERPA